MDSQVARALAKWPNVPACFGWLRLDRRGNWRIQDQIITHRRSIDFLSRNYLRDEHGQWFVQNGPQRAYCTLDYTPWIYHLDGSDDIYTHTAARATELRRVFVDDAGDILLEMEFGIGLLDDRDLARFINAIDNPSDADQHDSDLLTRIGELSGEDTIAIDWRGQPTRIRTMEAAAVAAEFEFIADPAPANNTM